MGIGILRVLVEVIKNFKGFNVSSQGFKISAECYWILKILVDVIRNLRVLVELIRVFEDIFIILRKI